jgi:hypothetical protein
MVTATTVLGLLAAEHPVDRGLGHPELVCDLLDGVPPPLAVVVGLLLHRPRAIWRGLSLGSWPPTRAAGPGGAGCGRWVGNGLFPSSDCSISAFETTVPRTSLMEPDVIAANRSNWSYVTAHAKP